MVPMVQRALCTTAIILWLVGVAALAWIFVQGSTAVGTDRRTAILLTSQERALILSEMRQLLAAVHGILAGLSHHDRAEGRKLAVQAARSGGMAQAADVAPSLMLKLPLAFKQMGMSVHRDLDRLAEDLAGGAGPESVLPQLASITSRCVACHDAYALSDRQGPDFAHAESILEDQGIRRGSDTRKDDQDPYGFFRPVIWRSSFQESFAEHHGSNVWDKGIKNDVGTRYSEEARREVRP